jgi:hypothetical protein
MSKVYFSLASGSFFQDWTNIGLITVNDDWSAVPSIEGFLGQDIVTTAGTNPATALTDSLLAGDLSVLANQTNPGFVSAGDVAEFHLPNPTIALQASGTADAPHIILYLDAAGRRDVTLSLNARDIDNSTDDVVKEVAVQYRIGETGLWTNLPPPGQPANTPIIADATQGGTATLVTPVTIVLPDVTDNASQLQIRVLTTNEAGAGEWVGIDDIAVTSIPLPNARPTIDLDADNSTHPGNDYEQRSGQAVRACRLPISISRSATATAATFSRRRSRSTAAFPEIC